jgi:hypothetical protein
VKRALWGAGLAVVGLIGLCEWLGASAPAPTIDSMRAACASAPDPDGCFALAVAKVTGPRLEAAQRAAVDNAVRGQ